MRRKISLLRLISTFLVISSSSVFAASWEIHVKAVPAFPHGQLADVEVVLTDRFSEYYKVTHKDDLWVIIPRKDQPKPTSLMFRITAPGFKPIELNSGDRPISFHSQGHNDVADITLQPVFDDSAPYLEGITPGTMKSGPAVQIMLRNPGSTRARITAVLLGARYTAACYSGPPTQYDVKLSVKKDTITGVANQENDNFFTTSTAPLTKMTGKVVDQCGPQFSLKVPINVDLPGGPTESGQTVRLALIAAQSSLLEAWAHWLWKFTIIVDTPQGSLQLPSEEICLTSTCKAAFHKQ